MTSHRLSSSRAVPGSLVITLARTSAPTSRAPSGEDTDDEISVRNEANRNATAVLLVNQDERADVNHMKRISAEVTADDVAAWPIVCYLTQVLGPCDA